MAAQMFTVLTTTSGAWTVSEVVKLLPPIIEAGGEVIPGNPTLHGRTLVLRGEFSSEQIAEILGPKCNFGHELVDDEHKLPYPIS